MISAIFQLLAAIFPFVLKKWGEADQRKADPVHQHKKRYEQIDNDIASGDPLANSNHVAGDLDELDRLQINQGHQRGSDLNPS